MCCKGFEVEMLGVYGYNFRGCMHLVERRRRGPKARARERASTPCFELFNENLSDLLGVYGCNVRGCMHLCRKLIKSCAACRCGLGRPPLLNKAATSAEASVT